jgi:1,4-alpha-glucan branching enzyme
MNQAQPAGYITFTLHAHLPWVVHHGTWPHGLEWLLGAAAETYLPLLRVLNNLERDGLALKANINLLPYCWSSLRTPHFEKRVPQLSEAEEPRAANTWNSILRRDTFRSRRDHGARTGITRSG